MNIVLPLIVLGLALTVIGNVSNFFISSRKTSREVEMQVVKMDAAREMGAMVRAAYDLSEKTGNACNSDTRRRNSDNGVPLCWPRHNDGCFEVSGMQVCRSSGFVTNNSALPSKYWVALIFPSAFAARTLSTPQSPTSGAGAADGVQLSFNNLSGNPAAATTFAPNCSNANTRCITVSFCVDFAKRNRCTNTSDIYVSQTYAIMRF